jgi:hypothetical protein
LSVSQNLALKADEADLLSDAGIQQFDELKYGKCLAILGSLVVYRTPKRVKDAAQSKQWSDFASILTLVPETDADRHRISNIVLFYVGGICALEEVFDHLTNAFSKSKVTLCAGLTDNNAVVVFVKKMCYRKLPDLRINSAQPQFYKLPVHKQSNETIISLLTDLNKCMGKTVSNMRINRPSGDISFEQFLADARQLSSVELMTLKGKCEMVPWKKRSDFQHSFLRVYFSLAKVIELEKQQFSCQMISAHAPEVDIVPLAELRNLATVFGNRLKGVGLGFESHSLYDLLTKPELLNKHGVLLLGSMDTTGFGKSQFAKRLAVEWSKAMCEAMGLHRDRAVVVITNTIDAAREIQFKPGMVWVLDEFEVGDREQVIYMSGNMLKVLFTIAEPGSLRCRMSDLSLPAGVARIVTANADEPAQWTGSRCPWSSPIERKAICFQVKKRLCSSDWGTKASSTTDSAAEAAAVLESARTALLAQFKELKLEAPQEKKSFLSKLKVW